MGSMKTWKPDKEKLEKVILRQFNCRSYAERWESVTIFKHLTNPLNRNYSLNRNHLTKTQRKQYNWIIRLKCKSLD